MVHTTSAHLRVATVRKMGQRCWQKGRSKDRGRKRFSILMLQRPPLVINPKEGWPLHLLDLKDNHHMSVTYKPVGHQILSGQQSISLDDGASSREDQCLWARSRWLDAHWKVARLQWNSSDLLPEELSLCNYKECVDGQILHYLTTESIMTSRMLSADWSVTKLFDQVAAADPPFHVLLNVCALVAGMSNYMLAKYLLAHGCLISLLVWSPQMTKIER